MKTNLSILKTIVYFLLVLFIFNPLYVMLFTVIIAKILFTHQAVILSVTFITTICYYKIWSGIRVYFKAYDKACVDLYFSKSS